MIQLVNPNNLNNTTNQTQYLLLIKIYFQQHLFPTMPSHNQISSTPTIDTPDRLKDYIQTSKNALQEKTNENISLCSKIKKEHAEFYKISEEINEMIKKNEALISKKKMQSQFAQMIMNKSHCDQVNQPDDDDEPDEETAKSIEPKGMILLHYYGTINNDPKIEANHNCSICLSNTTPMSTFITPCNHHFHQKCAFQWFHEQNNGSCPMCRHNCKPQGNYEFEQFQQVINGESTTEPTPISPDPIEHGQTFEGASPDYMDDYDQEMEDYYQDTQEFLRSQQMSPPPVYRSYPPNDQMSMRDEIMYEYEMRLRYAVYGDQQRPRENRRRRRLR